MVPGSVSFARSQIFAERPLNSSLAFQFSPAPASIPNGELPFAAHGPTGATGRRACGSARGSGCRDACAGTDGFAQLRTQAQAQGLLPSTSSMSWSNLPWIGSRTSSPAGRRQTSGTSSFVKCRARQPRLASAPTASCIVSSMTCCWLTLLTVLSRLSCCARPPTSCGRRTRPPWRSTLP